LESLKAFTANRSASQKGIRRRRDKVFTHLAFNSDIAKYANGRLEGLLWCRKENDHTEIVNALFGIGY